MTSKHKQKEYVANIDLDRSPICVCLVVRFQRRTIFLHPINDHSCLESHDKTDAYRTYLSLGRKVTDSRGSFERGIDCFHTHATKRAVSGLIQRCVIERILVA